MSHVMVLREKNIDDASIKLMVNKIFNHFLDASHNNVKNILIKPNLMYYWDASTGETTDPALVAIIIDALRERFGNNVEISIVESDASAMRTKYVFPALGYTKLSESKKVNLINLSEGELIKREVMLKNQKIEIKVNQTLLDSDFIINIPKLKVHRDPPVISCALKNYFGLISTRYKFQYHPKIEKYVAAINKLVRQDLIIVDGLVSLGKYPKKLGTLLASNDPVSCDLLASKIAGRNPRRDIIISEAIKEGIGQTQYELFDPESILDDLIDGFPRVNSFTSGILWQLQLFMLRTYAKLIGDILPPVLNDKV